MGHIRGDLRSPSAHISGRDYLRSPCFDRARVAGRPQVAPTIAALVLFLLLLTACTIPAARFPASPLSPLPAPSRAPGPLGLTIVHSNDTWGYLDPCG